MKNKYTWLFIISSIFLNFKSVAQEKSQNESPKKETKTFPLRVGLDLFRITHSLLDKDYQGFEFVGDLKVGKQLYIATEIGNEKRTIQSEGLNFSTSGSYIKLGVDYNMYKNWPGLNNNIYFGLRYGVSTHQHTLNSYQVYINHHYWKTPITTNGFANGERPNISTSWIELVFGIKVELIYNFYLGLNLRLHRIMSNPQPNNFGNLYAPGYNKITDNNHFGSSINYTLTYSLPIRFKKLKAFEVY